MIVGLTGGIGSGKSTIAKIFNTFGAYVYDSDSRAKAMYFVPSVKSQIIPILGKEAYITDTELNRKYIADIIFNDKYIREQVNDIILPALNLDFSEFKNKLKPTDLIIYESAILFESNHKLFGLHNTFDHNILVTAPTELKIERVMSRSNLTREEVIKRMEAQWTDEDRKYYASYVIENNDNKHFPISQILSFIKQISEY